MANTFHRQGHDVYYRGYLVAALLPSDAPPTIMAEVEEMLDACDPDAIDPDEHKADLDALEKAEGDLDDAKERIAQLERELEDERDTIERLRNQIDVMARQSNESAAQIAALESMLKAAAP